MSGGITPVTCPECGFDQGVYITNWNGRYIDEWACCPICGFHSKTSGGYGAYQYHMKSGVGERGVFEEPPTPEEIEEMVNAMISDDDMVYEECYLAVYSRKEGVKWIVGSPDLVDPFGVKRNAAKVTDDGSTEGRTVVVRMSAQAGDAEPGSTRETVDEMVQRLIERKRSGLRD